MNEYEELLAEIQAEVSEAVKELINDEVLPLLIEREKTEKAIAIKAIEDMYRAEEEAR